VDNLPLPTTSYVARDGELARLDQLLRDNRLTTITGAGGSGKTRLALELAGRHLNHFADGVWLVDLAPLGEPSIVVQTIATTLGLHDDAGRSPADALTDYLRARRALLILDNCEHLIEACAAIVNRLVGICPEVRILATSREMLGVPGEVVWRVASLSTVDPRALGTSSGDGMVAQLLHAESARLFLDRARLGEPLFAINERNAEDVARICQRLDGIPLAIELAAARLPMLSLQQLASRLEHHFDLLAGGHRTAPRRQQTLRATIEWSYDLLADDERRLLCRLAVFAGGWSLEAAEALEKDVGPLGQDSVELLIRLVAKSMVLVVEDPQQDDERSTRRYRLLEPIRQFAEEQLAATGGVEHARTWHRDWYLAVLDAALDGMEGPDQKRWLNWLDVEHDNLLAALRWSEADADSSRQLLRQAGIMGRYWQAHGLSREGIYWLEIALARADVMPTADRARALNWLGQLEIGNGHIERVLPFLEESVAQARAIGDRRIVSLALRHLGQAMLSLDRNADALEYFREALTVSRVSGPLRETAWNLSTVGVALTLLGRYSEAEAPLHESIALGRQAGDSTAVTNALRALGELYRLRGDVGLAHQSALEGLDVAGRTGSKLWSLSLLVTLGDIAAAEPDWRSAAGWYRQGLEIARPAGLPGTMAYTLRRYAASCVARRDHATAARIYGSTAGILPTAWALLFPPPEREEDVERSTRLALGDARFSALWSEGAALSLDQLIGEILRDPVATADPYAGLPLSMREQQVAGLIAVGYTNRQIAKQLVIAEPTAERHVANIFQKLGVNARAQVAAWAVEHLTR
jgi:non-specific serine/threonine protein kinase